MGPLPAWLLELSDGHFIAVFHDLFAVWHFSCNKGVPHAS